jgi:hypothetical protein
MYSQKEASRDGQEREFMEEAIEKLMDGFISLIVNVGTEAIPVNLMFDDLKKLKDDGYDDVLEMVQPNNTGDMATLVINPEDFRGAEFRFNITPGTTAAVNKAKQKQDLVDFITVISKFQNQIESDPSVQINWGRMMQTLKEVTDIPGIEDFITILPPEVVAMQQQQMMEQQAQANADAMIQSSQAVQEQQAQEPDPVASAIQEVQQTQ